MEGQGKAFKNPSKTFQEGVEIDDALGFLVLKNQLNPNTGTGERGTGQKMS